MKYFRHIAGEIPPLPVQRSMGPVGRALRCLLVPLLLGCVTMAHGFEPIRPLPRSIEYDSAKAHLGKRLFFDRNLSVDRTVSCATCHDPKHGGAEPRSVSTGIYRRQGNINAPTVYNSYFNFRQFWNGRAADLKEQAVGPLHNPVEMGMAPGMVEQRLGDDPAYRKAFADIYGREIRFDDAVDAIVEFEKALVTPDSKLDRYLRGEAKLGEEEADGYRLFKTLGCVTCHNGVNVGGNSYQYLGAVIPVDIDARGGDLYARTGKPFDRNRFKVPSLRNIELTAPYLHDGSIDDLDGLIETMAYHNLGFRLSREEIGKIKVFFGTLTGNTPEILLEP